MGCIRAWSKSWTLLARFFGKMGDFINFEAAQVDVADDAMMEDEKCESAQTKWYEFIDDETQIDDNIED